MKTEFLFVLLYISFYFSVCGVCVHVCADVHTGV